MQCRAGQGRAGQGRAGQGRAGQGRAGQGRAVQCCAVQGRAGQGRAEILWVNLFWTQSLLQSKDAGIKFLPLHCKLTSVSLGMDQSKLILHLTSEAGRQSLWMLLVLLSFKSCAGHQMNAIIQHMPKKVLRAGCATAYQNCVTAHSNKMINGKARCTCLLRIAPVSGAHNQGSHGAVYNAARLGSLPFAYRKSLQSRSAEIDKRQELSWKPAFCWLPADSVLQM